MKNITLLLALLLSLTGFSQQSGEVAIFDNSGYQFHVILNGIMQNEKAESNVRIQGLRAAFYSCKVMADDNTFALDKNIIVKQDTLITYRIVNKRGKFKLRFFSEVPLNAAPAPVSTQSIVAYHAEEATNTEVVNSTNTTTATQSTTTTINTTDQSQSPTSTSIEADLSVSGSQGSQNETINTTTTTTETRDGVNSNTTVGTGEESISISMSVGENGANVNVQGTGLEGQEGVIMNTEITGSESVTHSEQTITTITTTTTSGSGTWDEEEVEISNYIETDDSRDYTDCFVGEEDFELFLNKVTNETFEDDRTNLTTDFVDRKCLSVEQVGQLMDQFDFSDNRMTVAKAAYNLCYETSDYFLLQEKFTFDDDKEEFRNFINNQ